MEMFDVKRRDITSFEDYLKERDNLTRLIPATGKGSIPEKDKPLKQYIREISRHPLFNHPTFDNNYFALGIKQAGNKAIDTEFTPPKKTGSEVNKKAPDVNKAAR